MTCGSLARHVVERVSAIAQRIARRARPRSTQRLLAVAAVAAITPGIAAAQPALGNLSTILAAMPESSWVKVNLNPFSAAWTPVDLQVPPYNGPSKPHAIIAAWSSFAWDGNRGDLILFGGGHANYAGNEVYCWHGTSQLWERASVPSEVRLIDSTYLKYTAIDGAFNAPASSHTYDNQLFLKRLDRFVTFGGAAFNSGGAEPILLANGTIRATGPFLWDPSRGDPNKVGGTTGSHVQRVAPHPEIVGGQMWQNLDIYDGRFSGLYLPGSFIQGVSDVIDEGGYDTVYITGRYGAGTDQNLYRMQVRDIGDRSKDVWTQVGHFYAGVSTQGAGAIDPVRRIFLRTGRDNSVYFTYWNLDTPGPNNRDVAIKSLIDATGSFSMNPNYGMDFDPVRSQFVLYNGGGTVWLLDPPTPFGPAGWVISKAPDPAGAIPPASYGTGILGKFKYIANVDAFMLLDVNGDVWLWKPLGWTDPQSDTPPTVSLTSPAEGSSYVTPASIALSAQAGDVDGHVVRVDFYAGTTLIGSASGGSYSMTWSGVGAGSYSLTAKAFDDAGASTTSQPVNVTVTLPPNDPPSVSIRVPSNGAHFAAGTGVDVTADAGDDDGTIASVVLYADGVAFATPVGTGSYTATATGLAVGPHVLTARATDNAGASTLSAPVNVTVDPPVGSGTVTLQDGAGGYAGTRDTYLDSYNVNHVWGSATQILEYGGNYGALVRFAVFVSEGGPVPDGATITSATLSLYKQTAYDQAYELRRVLKDWAEGQATWNKADGLTPWAVAGAKGLGSDIDTAVAATASVGWNPGWVDFDVTSSVAAMSAGLPNYGWKMQGTGGTLALKRFTAREAADFSHRPVLAVSFTMP
jgi:hypothetical protein